MIRKFEQSDMDAVLAVWREASVRAQRFMDEEFWESKIDAMRNIYLPASETYVFTEHEAVRGFFSLSGDMLAAMFVSPEFQGKGIGRQMMAAAKSLRSILRLTVYRENPGSIEFYQKCGFAVIREEIDEHTGHAELLMEYRA